MGGVKFSSEQREHRWDEVLWIRCFSPRIVISSAAGPRVAKERKTKLGRSEIQTAVERAFPTPTRGALSMMSRHARALLKVKRSAARRSTLRWQVPLLMRIPQLSTLMSREIVLEGLHSSAAEMTHICPPPRLTLMSGQALGAAV